MLRPYVSKWQPRREDPEGVDYRTYHNERPYVVTNPKNMVVQTALYRWTLSLDFTLQVSQANLYDYLVGWLGDTGITKRHVGSTILQAVPYNPRILKGVTKNNPVACQTYVFHHREDLQYGLEWMLTVWYPRFLRTVALAEDIPDSPDQNFMAEELTLLGNLNDDEWVENVVDPILSGQFQQDEPDWKTLLANAPRDGWVAPRASSKPAIRKL